MTDRKPSLIEWLQGPRPINIDDVPWLVKDFDILYQVASATLDIETLGDAHRTRTLLRAQIERLRPAFEQVQALKQNIRRGRN